MGGVRGRDVARRVRESTGLSSMYDLRVLRQGAEPRGDRFVKLPLRKEQRAFLSCAATLGVAYVDAKGENFMFDSQMCSGVHFANGKSNKEAASRNIAYINEFLPKLNAGMVWARRNWVLENLMIPVVKASEAASTRLKKHTTPIPAGANNDGISAQEAFPIKNVKFSPGGPGEVAYALVDKNGYIDLTKAGEASVYWVPLHPRKKASRYLKPACKTAMQKKIGEKSPTGGALDEKAFDSITYWDRMLAGPAKAAAAEMEDASGNNVANTNIPDGSGATTAADKATNMVAAANALATARTKFQTDRSGLATKYATYLTAAYEKCAPITNEGYGLYGRIFSESYDKFYEHCNMDETDPSGHALYDETIRGPAVAGPTPIPEMPRVATQADPFRIEFRDVDLRVPVVTGMEVVYVRQALDEGEFAVYPTKLFAWSERLEEFSNAVTKYVNLHGNKSFMDKLQRLLSSDRDILRRFRDLDIQSGGYKGATDTSLDSITDIALEHLQQCGALPIEHPDIRKTADLKKHTIKLSGYDNPTAQTNAAGDTVWDPVKQELRADVGCEVETRADGSVVGMTKPFHELFFSTDSNGKINAENLSEETKSLYRDLSTEINKKSLEKRKNREKLFGETSRSRR